MPEARSQKPKRGKVVRDSFTMPADEYQRLRSLKKRTVALGTPMKKSELLRAGVAMVHSLSDDALRETAANVTSVKTGRPAGKKRKPSAG